MVRGSLQLWLWTVLVFCLFLTAADTKESRIVGGEYADHVDYPFQVALEYNKYHRCSATIMSKNWVVTAAHCLQNAKTEDLRVRWGTPVRGFGGKVHQATRLLTHHNFVPGDYDYDIALIKVSPDFEPKTSIDLVERDLDLNYGQTAVVVGWGADDFGGWLSNKLQTVEMSVIGPSICQSLYSNIGEEVTPRMICGTHLETSPRGPCTGDSGAPLVMDGKLLGIVSWGYGCNNDLNNPGVFTNVRQFRTWIETYIGETPGSW